jgi:hypothetical protein
MLRINHPMLQLQSLKLIKSQMPWCGRKWRQGELEQSDLGLIERQHEGDHFDLPQLPAGTSRRLARRY